jgi:ubiquinol-cytochrome c reductase iron-sulfur subunit
VTDSHGNIEPADDHTDGHGDGHGGELVPDEPIANPGLPEHHPRPTDIDPAKEKRAELQVAAFFGLSAICTILFGVSYFTFDIGDNWHVAGGLGASNVALGVTLGLSLLFIGIAIIHWSRKLMGDHELVEMRHPSYSEEVDRKRTLDDLKTGFEETGIARRPLIVRSALGSLALLGVPTVILLRDLGTLPGDKLEHTIWGQGGRKIKVIEDGEEVEVTVPLMRIARDAIGTPILASDLEIGDLVNAQPEVLFNPERYYVEEAEVEGAALQTHKSKASLILLRMEPADITPGKGREDWSVNGIVAYSKICTHVGCPISLNERTTHHLLCPCHQSTFDMTNSGKVVFGPAGRPLPQLPIAVDEQGYLVAQRDFTEPVGPSFWERDYERDRFGEG